MASEEQGRKKSAEDGGDRGPQGTMYVQVKDVFGPAGAATGGSEAGDTHGAYYGALVGLSGPFEGQQFRLRPGRTTIGRGDDNDLAISEPSISTMHARIIGSRDGWRVLNVLSTNGTFVNGRKVHEAALAHGDRVRFGGVEFLFLTSEGIAAGRRLGSRLWTSRWLWWLLAVLVIGAGLAWWLAQNGFSLQP